MGETLVHIQVLNQGSKIVGPDCAMTCEVVDRFKSRVVGLADNPNQSFSSIQPCKLGGQRCMIIDK